MKQVLVMILGCAFAVITYSQAFDGGISFGGTISQIDGDNAAGYDKLGVNGGVFVSRDIGLNGKGQMELKYHQKGSRKYNKVAKNIDFKIGLQYIELPVLYYYTLLEDVSFSVGLSPAWLLSARIYDKLGYVEDASVDFKPFDMQGIAGMNYQIKDNWQVDVRFGYSFVSILDSYSVSTYFFRLGSYNNLLSVNMFYLFK